MKVLALIVFRIQKRTLGGDNTPGSSGIHA